MACGGHCNTLPSCSFNKGFVAPTLGSAFSRQLSAVSPFRDCLGFCGGPYSKTEQYGRLKAKPSGPSLEWLWRVLQVQSFPWVVQDCPWTSISPWLLSLPIPALFPNHSHPMPPPPSSDVDHKSTPLWTSRMLNSISESVSLGTQPTIWSVSKYTKPDITLTC